MNKIANKHKLVSRKNQEPGRGELRKSAVKPLYEQLLDENVAEIDFEVKCSYVEIYNETIFDLLDNIS